MYKTWIVACREYMAAVKSKSFLISIILLPLLMGGGSLAQVLLQNQVDTSQKRFAVVDRTEGERLADILERALEKRNAEEIFDPESGEQISPVFTIERVAASAPNPQRVMEQRYLLSQKVRSGELFGFLEIGEHVLEGDRAQAAEVDPRAQDERGVDARAVRYQSNRLIYNEFHRWAQRVIEQAVQDYRLERAAVPADVVRSITQPAPLLIKGLTEKDQLTGDVQEAKDENPAISILIPAALMLLMFMMILVGGTPAMQGVVEEKMQRIAEVMLGSVRPFQLMMGKLLGLMAVSLTLSALYLSAAYWAAWHYELTEMLSLGLMAWFLVYLMLAIVMYGSLFIAVGAACSDIRDTQTMLWPVMLVAMLPLFVWINVAKEPTSTFATAISFVPFATPMLMLIRIAVPPGIGFWQPLLGLLLMLVTTVLCVYLAGRIFRVGMLMQGKGASVRDLARWVIYG